MSQTLTLKVKGLYTLPSELSEVPDGALAVADNIVIDGESVAQPRRGFDRQTYGFSSGSDRASKLFGYRDQLLAHSNSNQLSYYSGSGWSAYSGTYSVPSGADKIRAAESNSNFYFTSSEGIKKLDNYTSSVINAGAPTGLDGTGATTGASGFMADNSSVAYRVVWSIEDTNKNLILGAPSQRIIVSNTSGGTRDVSLTFTIPSTITTSYSYKVYRSNASATAATEPDDECKLVYDNNPTSAEITAKAVTITDSTPSSLRGESLYTNASQEGILQANTQPPIAKDMAVFQEVMFYGNTVSKHRYYTTLISVGGTGLVNGDVLAISGLVFTGAAAETVANAEFKVSTGGSAAQNIEDTAKSLVKVINQYSGNTTLYAYYLSGFDDLPGQILIEERGLGSSAFYVSTSRQAAWNPRPPLAQVFVAANVNIGTEFITVAGHGYSNGTAVKVVGFGGVPAGLTAGTTYYIIGATANTFQLSATSGGSAINLTSTGSAGNMYVYATTESSDNETLLNGLYFSKPQQPEGVPLTNLFKIGSAQKEIRRIIPLRDSLFILKDDGCFRLTGVYPNYRVDSFDNTVRLIAPEAAVNLNNQVFCLTDQGVVTITETGVSVVSRPIENIILELFGASQSGVDTYSFGVAYESDRKYILFTISNAGDLSATQAYVFNTFTNTWTRWPLSQTCGLVNPANNKLYLGDVDTNYVFEEIKNYDSKDIVDFRKTTTITVVSGNQITVSDASEISVGDIIRQSSSVFASITAINGSVLTVGAIASFTLATATIYGAIPVAIEWVPTTGGNPGIMKQFRETTFLFKEEYTGDCDISFNSEISPNFETVTITGTARATWGLFAWGGAPWGGAARKRPTRTYVLPEKQRCSQLSVKFEQSVGYSFFKLNGLSVIFEPGSERVIK